MANDKHTAVWAWLRTCSSIKDTFFIFSTDNAGDTAISPITAYKDTIAEEYVDGSTYRYYDLAIIRFANYSNEPNDTENISVLNAVEAIASWVESQDEAGTYPTFPEGCSVQSVTVLPTSNGIAAAIGETGAKYMLQIRIEYIQAA